MKEYHQKAIQRITEYFKDNPAYLALITGDSDAKGYEKKTNNVFQIMQKWR